MSQTPIAGTNLGLTRQDLLNLLFSEDEGDLGGFVYAPPKQYSKSYSSQVPLTGTFTSKGRGNVLGYQQGGSPSLEISGALEDVVPLIPGATGGKGGVENLPGARGIDTTPAPDPAPAPAPTPTPVKPVVQEKADRLLSSFIGELGQPGTIGAMGVGRALEYGYTKPEIITKARVENLDFGEQAAKGLGLGDTPTYIGEFGDPEGKALGLNAVKRMWDAGLSDNTIKSLAAQQGMTFGEKARTVLDVPEPAPKLDPALSQFMGEGGTAGFLGKSAVDRARQSGLSDDYIRSLASKQGYQFGSAAFS